MTTLTSFNKTDLVDDHLAADVNKLIAASIRPEYANTETISATKVLADIDCQYQFLTASGADRTVKLAPEATTNHITIVYNSGASNNIVVQDDSGTYTFATLAPGEWLVFLPLNASGWTIWAPPTERYKISVTVASNNLTVALKHLDGTDPTTVRPIMFVINGVKRYVTAATSITLNAATNWFNAGSAELATKEIDYFLYAIWDSNSTVVAIGQARISHGRLVSDFSATTTNEKYLGNYANYTSTDDVINIGRFAATLSAGAGYTWTVPTFTSVNLIQQPFYETRWLDWVPAWTASAGTITSISQTIAKYQIVFRRLHYENLIGAYTLSTTPGNLNATLPMTGARTANLIMTGAMLTVDSGSTAFGGQRLNNTSPDQLTYLKYNAANWATGVGVTINSNGSYEI
jgi:hypothetical protein